MKTTARLVALLVLVLMVFGTVSGCSLDDAENANPVIMKVNDLEITKFDFHMRYLANESYYEFMYGAINAKTYFDIVMEDVTEFAVAVNHAKETGRTLSADVIIGIENDVERQCEYVYNQYLERIDETITGEEEIRAAVYDLYQQEMGYTLDDYRGYLYNYIYNNTLLREFRDSIVVDVTPGQDEIIAYINHQVIASSMTDFATFANGYDLFLKGEGGVPYFVPRNCFTVNTLFIAFDSETDDDGNTTYDDTAALETAQEIDKLIRDGISSARFEDMIAEMGDDELMKNDDCRDWGYLINESLIRRYETGFVYAAMNLKNGKWLPKDQNINDMPELTKFKTNDNHNLIKVRTESGIHYLIINRVFLKGEMPYQIGDALWNFAYDGAYEAMCDIEYDNQYETWLGSAKITYYYERFQAEYLPNSNLQF